MTKRPQGSSTNGGSDASQQRASVPAEARSTEALTVLWMLASVATLAGQAVALVAWGVASWTNPGPTHHAARILSGWFLLSAVGTGLLSLILTPIVQRVRRSKPPLAITLGVVGISLTPVVLLIVVGLN